MSNVTELYPYVAEINVKYADTGRTNTSLHGTVDQIIGMLYGLICDLLENDILAEKEVVKITDLAISDYKKAACQSGEINKQFDTNPTES